MQFFVKVKNTYRKIPLAGIVCLQAGAIQVDIIMDTQTVTIRGTLTGVIGMLPEELFCRIHESYAVAVEKIVSFNNESVVVKAGKKSFELPMGKFHRQLLEKKNLGVGGEGKEIGCLFF